MEPSLIKTNIDETTLGGKATLLNAIMQKTHKYVYKLSKEGKFYILKGNVLRFPSFDSPEASTRYPNNMKKLGFIYQEFYLSKVASVMSINFAVPLQIASKIELPKPPEKDATLYVEALYEYGGEPLSSFKGKDCTIQRVYKWMRQSANALSMLHKIGISHLDIKPDNMVYDPETNILKIIDLGISVAYVDSKKLYKVTSKLSGKMRGFTEIYSPPEVIQIFGDKSMLKEYVSRPEKFIIGNVDVYCWAMGFYSLLLEKSSEQLQENIEKYHCETRGKYNAFLEDIKKEFARIKTNDGMECEMKNAIEELLIQALAYDPNQRPKMNEIAKTIKLNSNGSLNTLKERNIEKENIARMLEILDVHDKSNFIYNIDDQSLTAIETYKTKSPYKLEEEEKNKEVTVDQNFKQASSTEKSKNTKEFKIEPELNCENCEKGINCQVELKCGHKICISCASKKVFMNNILKNQIAGVKCKKCKEEVKEIGIYFMSLKIECFTLRCGCNSKKDSFRTTVLDEKNESNF